MHKRRLKRALSRTADQRHALLRSLARELILRDRISTTLAKAKVLRPFIEKVITRARMNTLASRRAMAAYFDAPIVKRLMSETAPRFAERAGGYTRIVKLGVRAGDRAEMALIEFVTIPVKEKKPSKK